MRTLIRNTMYTAAIGMAFMGVSCSSNSDSSHVPTTEPYASVPPDHPSPPTYPEYENAPVNAQTPSGPNTPPHQTTPEPQ
jgi:hypothetical protein